MDGLSATLEHTDDAERTVARLDGVIDLSTAGDLRAFLRRVVADRAEGSSQVVLDLSAVTFLDSVGLGLLVQAHERLAAAGGELVLRAVPRRVRRVLEVAGLVGLLRIEP